MPPHIDPTTPVREEEIEDESGHFHTPVATHTGAPSSPPAPPRFTSRPYLGTHLILNIAHSHSLPALWTPHRDGGLSNTDDEVPTTNLRYPITLTSALLDITNTHWSDTEDDNDSDYDGDDESEGRENESDLMVYMVESDENDPAPVLSPMITPLPQVEGDPTSFEEEAAEVAAPIQEQQVQEGIQDALDSMEDVAEIISSSEDEMVTEHEDDSTSTSTSSLDLTERVQPAAVFHAEPAAMRYSRRHSLHGFNKDVPRRQMMSFHRRHSMGEVAMIAV